MATYKAYSKDAAREKAKKMRKMGYNCSIYNLKGKGYSITVKKKK